MGRSTDDDWHRCFHNKWLKVLAGLNPSVGYTYLIVCFRIYEQKGPCPDDVNVLARRTGLAPHKISAAIEELIRMGKLQRQGNRGLINTFAQKNIEAKSKKQPAKISLQDQQSSVQELHLSDSDSIQGRDSKEGTTEKERKTPHRIPESLELSQRDRLFARQHFTDSEITTLFEAYKRHHISKGTKFVRWAGPNSAWETWVGNEIKWRKQRTPSTKQPWQESLDNAESFLRKNREGVNGRGSNQSAANADQRKISGPEIPRSGGDVHSRSVASRTDTRP